MPAEQGWRPQSALRAQGVLVPEVHVSPRTVSGCSLADSLSFGVEIRAYSACPPGRRDLSGLVACKAKASKTGPDDGIPYGVWKPRRPKTLPAVCSCVPGLPPQRLGLAHVPEGVDPRASRFRLGARAPIRLPAGWPVDWPARRAAAMEAAEESSSSRHGWLFGFRWIPGVLERVVS